MYLLAVSTQGTEPKGGSAAHETTQVVSTNREPCPPGFANTAARSGPGPWQFSARTEQSRGQAPHAAAGIERWRLAWSSVRRSNSAAMDSRFHAVGISLPAP